jgi:hypothetical protein
MFRASLCDGLQQQSLSHSDAEVVKWPSGPRPPTSHPSPVVEKVAAKETALFPPRHCCLVANESRYSVLRAEEKALKSTSQRQAAQRNTSPHGRMAIGALFAHIVLRPQWLGPMARNQVCWMAERCQVPPAERMKVHSSVTSLRSPPSTIRSLARSIMLSLSANLMATVA